MSIGAVVEGILWVAAWTLIYTVIGLAVFVWIDNAPYRLPRWMSPFERVFAALTRVVAATFEGQLRATRALARGIGSAGRFASRSRR
ncbi:membrane protein [Gordonia phage Archis]|nr:membrane protein [Gordonia phage Archis]